ncbi:MAG: rRNA pseudouridine synthase [Planctomycetes bacterium]|nr:rRNA pseudouridine synthase [Planctomycetota bacterium]MCB9869021.1 rRNA pseudouridine synthase [Planctomycetota bacterium]MCB9887981.1 rRNA pseudouridine synthase [Planctomycetota bacterium]
MATRRPAKKTPSRPAKRPTSPRGKPSAARGKKAAEEKPASRRVHKPKALRVTPLPGAVESDGKLRLNRFLATAGVCSRRAADELIGSGRVTVNGTSVRELGVRVDPARDDVQVDGQKVEPERKVYVLFNKPKGVVCTNARNEQRPRAIDFLEQVRGRIYTIGRLDADSEGLILLTNDGDFAQEMAHPSFGVPKTYAILVRGSVDDRALTKARGGVWLSDGRTSGASIHVERRGRDKTYLKVIIREGKNRELRRVFAKLGFPVLTLKRVRIGPLNLHRLREGAHRFLKPTEITELRRIAREGLGGS